MPNSTSKRCPIHVAKEHIFLTAQVREIPLTSWRVTIDKFIDVPSTRFDFVGQRLYHWRVWVVSEEEGSGRSGSDFVNRSNSVRST